VVFGAGALGLGFLGPELGGTYEMVYLDIPARSRFLDHLTASGEYAYNETGPSARTVAVRGPRGICVGDRDAVLNALEEAELVFTAVGEPNLPKVAPTLAGAAARRGPDRPLRILCCENGLEIANKLRGFMRSAGSAGQGPEAVVGDTVMGRMCKLVEPLEEGLSPVGPGFDWAVAAEPFHGIPVERSVLEGLADPGAAFQPMNPAEFAAREDVKMCAHNGVHAWLAFLGLGKGKAYFCELTDQPRLMRMAYEMLLEEVGEALFRKHGPALDRNHYLNYAPTILRRITCPGLHDTIARGTRGVMRKLQPWERLVCGARTIAEQGISPRLFATGLAAAILVACGTGETDLSFRQVLSEHCGLHEGEDGGLAELVEQRRLWLERDFGFRL